MSAIHAGAASLQAAVDAGTLSTAQYDSGLQVTGVFVEVLCDPDGNAIYLRSAGPTCLAWGGREIPGHGAAYHSEGFGSPIGPVRDLSRGLAYSSIEELRAHNIVTGAPAILEFASGISVRGYLREIHRQEHRNLLFSFADCTVTHPNGRVLFDPGWGTYDMAVGERITSVHDGAADREALRDW